MSSEEGNGSSSKTESNKDAEHPKDASPAKHAAASTAGDEQGFEAAEGSASKDSSTAATTQYDKPTISTAKTPETVVWLNPICETKNLHPDNFEVHDCLGIGGFGSVFLTYLKDTREKVALKCMAKGDEAQLKRRDKELTCWRVMCDHPNVVLLYVCFSTSIYYCFAMEYLHDSLKNIIAAHHLHNQMSLVSTLAAQLAHVIHTMHTMGFLHRDITCTNVMVTSDYQIKVIDFGLCVIGLSATNRAGTIAYMSPEVLDQKPYSREADWWSYGIVLFTMLHGKSPMTIYAEQHSFDYNDIPKIKRYKIARTVADTIEQITLPEHKKNLSAFFRLERHLRLGYNGDFRAIKALPLFANFSWMSLDAVLVRMLAK